MKQRRANLAADLVAMVDTAYEVDTPAQDWGARLLDATEQAVGGGIGGFACTFERKGRSTLCFEKETIASLGVPEAMLATIIDGLTNMPPHWMHKRLRHKQGTAFCMMTSE